MLPTPRWYDSVKATVPATKREAQRALQGVLELVDEDRAALQRAIPAAVQGI